MAAYWLKIAYFSYPSLIRRPRSLCSLWNFAVTLTTRNLESWGYKIQNGFMCCIMRNKLNNKNMVNVDSHIENSKKLPRWYHYFKQPVDIHSNTSKLYHLHIFSRGGQLPAPRVYLAAWPSILTSNKTQRTCLRDCSSSSVFFSRRRSRRINSLRLSFLHKT